MLMHVCCLLANASIAVKQSPAFDKNLSLFIYLRQKGPFIVFQGLDFNKILPLLLGHMGVSQDAGKNLTRKYFLIDSLIRI